MDGSAIPPRRTIPSDAVRRSPLAKSGLDTKHTAGEASEFSLPVITGDAHWQQSITTESTKCPQRSDIDCWREVGS